MGTEIARKGHSWLRGADLEYFDGSDSPRVILGLLWHGFYSYLQLLENPLVLQSPGITGEWRSALLLQAGGGCWLRRCLMSDSAVLPLLRKPSVFFGHHAYMQVQPQLQYLVSLRLRLQLALWFCGTSYILFLQANTPGTNSLQSPQQARIYFCTRLLLSLKPLQESSVTCQPFKSTVALIQHKSIPEK